MKPGRKRTSSLLRSLLPLVVGICLCLVQTAAVGADAKPYIKVFNDDVFAGGWFGNSSANCSTTDPNYQAPTFNPLQNQFEGGILGFATNNRHGSSVDFGAFAMGLIQGNPDNQYGFYSGQGTGTNGLSFSNTGSGISLDYWGGYLAGAAPQIHCIPDYFGTKQSLNPAPTPLSNSFNVGTLAQDQYLAPNGLTSDVSAGGTATIPVGTSTTVFVNGNVYISHNIVYAAGYTSDNVPKFALVVKGNIYIDPSVTQLDGLYIAQPSTGNIDGDIWTCHDSSNTTPDGYWIGANCGNKLTFNGAVIAKQVEFLRINGDLANAPDNEGVGSNNMAETINYIPAMVIGGPFFNQLPSQNPKINSLISLPPIF